MAAEKLFCMMLKKMKSVSEAFQGKELEIAVVTVLAHFKDSQLEATKDARVI